MSHTEKSCTKWHIFHLFQGYFTNLNEEKELQLTPVALRFICGTRPEQHPSVNQGNNFRCTECVAVERDEKDMNRT